jgi:hypothetical protein
LLSPALETGLDEVACGEGEGFGWPVILGLDGDLVLRSAGGYKRGTSLATHRLVQLSAREACEGIVAV